MSMINKILLSFECTMAQILWRWCFQCLTIGTHKIEIFCTLIKALDCGKSSKFIKIDINGSTLDISASYLCIIWAILPSHVM